MWKWIGKYACWLHTRWPAGVVEKLPEVDENGQTNVSGLYVVGDLTGIPLLKFSADTGARAVGHIAADADFQKLRGQEEEGVVDVAIIGAGVSGMAATLEARQADLSFEVVEASEPFSTIVNFPRGKPIYTYPTEMEPAGQLRFTAEVKEPLVAELKAQTLEQGIEPRPARVEQVRRQGELFEVVIPGEESLRARRVIVAIGRSGNFRKLGVPGEDLDKVYNRLHDPREFGDGEVLVVGGGDSALESAIAIAQCGGRVTLSYRKPEFSRPKPENIEKIEQLIADPLAPVGVEQPSSERVTTSSGAFVEEGIRPGSIRLMMDSQVRRIGDDQAVVENADGEEETLPNDAVFAMIGREAPLDFFRRSGVAIRGEWRKSTWISFALIMLAAVFVYHWKTDAGIPIKHWFQEGGLFPFNLEPPADPSSLWGTIRLSMTQPSFYYSLVYCLAVVFFGVRRMRRRRTPYVRTQTITLMLIQCVPLFLLPYVLLPWAGHSGWFGEGRPAGAGGRRALSGVAVGRPRPRVLAVDGADSGLAAVHLECVHGGADVGLAGDQPGADLCDHPAAHPALGQGSVLRLDLLVWSPGRDHGRRPPPEDAARAAVEPGEHGGPGGAGAGCRPAGSAPGGLGPAPRPLGQRTVHGGLDR